MNGYIVFIIGKVVFDFVVGDMEVVLFCMVYQFMVVLEDIVVYCEGKVFVEDVFFNVFLFVEYSFFFVNDNFINRDLVIDFCWFDIDCFVICFRVCFYLNCFGSVCFLDSKLNKFDVYYLFGIIFWVLSIQVLGL